MKHDDWLDALTKGVAPGSVFRTAPKPFYVKWHIGTCGVCEVNTQGWGATCSDSYIYYREPNEGDHVWYAYASRTLIGRALQPDQVPAEVRLAVELMK